MTASPSAVESRLDTRYAAETPEGIALWLRPAGVVPRFYAYLIDAAIKFFFFSISLLLLALLGTFGQGLALVLLFLLEWLYPVAFELSAGAATPGKRMVGLTVVLDSGLPITPAASLTRNLLRAADFLPSFYAFGLLSMLFRHDFKRLGDLAAGTLVVHTPRAEFLRGTPPPGRSSTPRSRRRRASADRRRPTAPASRRSIAPPASTWRSPSRARIRSG